MCTCVILPYPRLQVMPHRLRGRPVPEGENHLDLAQEHIPPQGLGVPHRQVQGPTPQFPDVHFILKKRARLTLIRRVQWVHKGFDLLNEAGSDTLQNICIMRDSHILHITGPHINKGIWLMVTKYIECNGI